MTEKLETQKRNKVTEAGYLTAKLGALLAALSALLGIAVLAMGGAAAVLLGVPVGILLMIAGNTQSTAAITKAMYERG